MELPAAPFDHRLVIDSSDAVTANELPESVLIVGGGYIGVEFACIYSICGVRVTVVEALDGLLPGLDKDCGRFMERTLKKRGATVITGARMEEVHKDEGGVRVRLSNGTELSAQRMLVCVGRRPDCTGLAIEKAGLQPGPKGQILTDGMMQTAQPHIYAIGDVTGRVLLAHVASQEGVVAASHAMGHPHPPIDYGKVPACVFGYPEIATVGMTEEQAKASAEQLVVKKFPLAARGKAQILGETDGFVKMLADGRTGLLLGVHICGPHASDLLGEAALALKLGCTAAQLAETIHTHPTMPEAIREAADGIAGYPINWRG